ncbi:MAG: non-heme iron oxygenase ferredoxin subunit [Anaerolineales bacterium]|nr:non-heme iron oxygenase ferredoxin subunit [Anaerolineales bacterium]MCZ2122204.1 non-heme iron oxygenase ferredoxin subunit [Anaerolineales bacterium]
MFNYTTLEEAQAEFIEIAPLTELPNGERLFVDLGDTPIVILNIAGKLFAIGDVCTHDGGPLGEGKVEGENIICPRHGAEFDIRTGKAVQLPAVEDIPAYPVQIRDGNIFIGVPK